MVAGVPTHDDGGPARQFLTFRLDGRHYALPVGEIAEVIRLPAVARVPQSPQGLLGLANLRGAVIPVASGRGLLGQPANVPTNDARAIVLEQESPVALAVDAVESLVNVAAAGVETRPADMAALPGEALRGAFQTASGGAIKILDLQPLLAAAFTPRSRKLAVSRRGAAETLSTAPPAASTKLLTFDVAGQEYALPLASVQEVTAAPALATGIPHAESVVLGVMGFRGTLLPLLSLRGLLGFSKGQALGTEKIVVTHVGGALIGLVADCMTTIISAADDQMEEIPEILAARVGGESRIRSIYRGDGGRRLIPVLSTEELFGEEVMRKLEIARNVPQAASQPDVTAQTVQFVVFRLGEDEFGLPVDAVEEVMRMPDQVARLPKTPKFLEGVVNLRGEVLPVVDQRRRFNMPAAESLLARRLIVVRTQRHRAGLIVDSVSEVLRAREDDIAAAPALTGESSALVRGVVNLEHSGRIILLLDPSELLTRAEHGLLDKFSREKATE